MAYVADKQLGGVVVITDVSASGVISTGTQVADTRAFTFEQVTPGISVDIASPVPPDPKMLTLSNRGSVDITVQGVVIEPGPAYGLFWNGTAFVPQTIEGKGKLSATEDTQSIAITGDGSPIAPLAVDVKLSAVTGNGIELRADGLYYKDPQPGKGQIIYVDGRNGDDTAGTGDFKAPFKTYAKANTIATANSLIIVYPGTYNEDLVLKSGTFLQGFAAKDGSIVKFTGMTTIGTDIGSLKVKDVILEGKPGNPTLNINGSTGGVIFDNVSIEHQSGPTTDVVVFNGNNNRSWYSFSSGSIAGNVVMNGNQAGYDVYIDGGAEAPTVTHQAAAATLVVSNRLQIGTVTHVRGALFMKNVGTVLKNTNGLSIISSANDSTPDNGYLALHDVGVVQLDGTFGTIQKTGTCAYVIGDIKSNPQNDTFTGTRVYVENAVHIHANYAAPTAYTPADPSLVGHLKGINTALAAAAGGLSAVTSADTNTVDFTGAGTVAQPLSADVKVSASANNVLQKMTDGLFVAKVDSGIDSVTHQNSGNLAMTGSGTVSDPLIGNVLLSTDPRNLIQEDVTNGGIVVLKATVHAELAFSISYNWLAQESLYTFIATEPYIIPQGMLGWKGFISFLSGQVPSSGTINVMKTGGGVTTQIGLITILSDTSITVTFDNPVTFNEGDVLSLVANNQLVFGTFAFTILVTRP